MNRIDACAPLPSPPTDAEKQAVKVRFSIASTDPNETSPCSTQVTITLAYEGVVSEGFADYIRSSLSRWSMSRFTHDWEGRFEDEFNQTALQCFLHTFKQAIAAVEYGVPLHPPGTPIVNGIPQPITDYDLKLTAMYYVHIQTLHAQYKAQVKNPGILTVRKNEARVRKAAKDVSTPIKLQGAVDLNHMTDILL